MFVPRLRDLPLSIVMSLTLLLPGLAGCGGHAPERLGGGAAVERGRVAKPNIVFVLTDDLTSDLLAYMPNVQQLARDGRTFTNYFVTDSFCCPSRSSIFTGQFPHDTGVYTNSGQNGGYNKFTKGGKGEQTFAVALHAAGYRTAMMGKYLNGYPDAKSYVPPGWDQWEVSDSGYRGYDYTLNENGRPARHGHAPAEYLTDVLSNKGVAFVDKSAAERKPFLLEVASFTPHVPATPAPRDGRRFLEVKAPRGPAFNQADMSAKPRWLRGYRKLTKSQIEQIDQQYVLRVQSVQAVDRMVGQLRATLRKNGLESSTYFVFSSDNGYHMGQYRLMPGKTTAFDTDIKVPLIVAGPSIPAATSTATMSENVDLAPTFEDLAGVKIPATVDGRSLVPLLFGVPSGDPPDAALIEHHGPSLDGYDPDRSPPAAGNPPSYLAIRTPSALYVEYSGGDVEYYDLVTDPYQLSDTAAWLSPAVRGRLHAALRALSTCHGASACSAAANLLGDSPGPLYQ